MKLIVKCEYCNKPAEIVSEEYLEALSQYLRKYSCGHSILADKLISTARDDDFNAIVPGKRAYPFQIEGIKFLEEHNFTGLNADQMGLGKTIQGLLVLRRNFQVLTPAIVIVKSATIYQWIREYNEWCSDEPMTICPVTSPKFPILPCFYTYVVSMDSLARNGLYKRLAAIKPKLIIIDECHSFKDPSAQRTKALLNLINEGNIQHKILLSGTPIKNRADEYFTALNMVAPEYFPSLSRFQSNWLEIDEKGKYSHIRHWLYDRFTETIKPFVIRREKKDVLPDLPKLSREYRPVVIEDASLKLAYNTKLKQIENEMEGWDNFELNDNLMALRRIVGKAKLPCAIEHIIEFLEQTEDDKLAIGIHHKEVRETIQAAIKAQGYKCLSLSGEDSAIQKEWIVKRFQELENRVCVLNMLAGGYGLNLQFCHDSLILERQWNSADEEQFESRFHRDGQKYPVNIVYLVAFGTIDQFFHDLVEEKRQMFGETIQGWKISGDHTAMRQLAEKAILHKL